MTLMDVSPYAIPASWRVATKFLYFFALSLALGGAATHLAAIRPATRAVTNREGASLERRSFRLLSLAGVVLLVGGYLQLAGRVARDGKGMPFASALHPSAIAHYLHKPAKPGQWVSNGQLVAAQNVGYLVAAAALLLLALRARHGLVWLALAATLFGTVVKSLPTDLAKQGLDENVHAVAGQLHIIGGCIWVGGLFLLGLLAARGADRDPGAGRVWAEVWRRFGVLALVSVALVLGSGLWLTWEHVGAPSQLWGTVYGRVLLLKVALVTALVVAGAWNQLRLMPAIDRARRLGDDASVFTLALRRFPRVVAVESVLALGVLVAVPFLSGSARKEAGAPAVGPIDLRTFVVGAVLVAVMVLSFWLTDRASRSRGAAPQAA